MTIDTKSFSTSNDLNKKRHGRINGLDILIEEFHRYEGVSEFSYNQALSALDNIQKSAQSKDQFIDFVLSDIIFTALHTTIMEEMFVTIRSHQEIAVPLIQKFSEATVERDKMINIHTKNHLRYLANNGECEGCSSCEGHKDIVTMLPRLAKHDVDYFLKLYLEVQTIYCALERVLYQFIPTHVEVVEFLDDQTMIQFRSYVAHYVTRRLTNT
jgi:hypothetical protein